MEVDTTMQKLSRLLYPDVCLCCNDRGENGFDLCRRCRERLPWTAYSCKRCGRPLADNDAETCGSCDNQDIYFDRTLAPFLFDQFIREAVYEFKFNGKLNYGMLLARLLVRYVRQRQIKVPDVLVPVPLYHKRLRKRGFNQALKVARVLGKSIHCPVSFKDVRRIRETQEQMELPAAQRYANVRNAFALRTSRSPFGGRRVAVIDDVMTTGNTVNEMAKCLKRAGAEEVHVWVIARTKPS